MADDPTLNDLNDLGDLSKTITKQLTGDTKRQTAELDKLTGRWTKYTSVVNKALNASKNVSKSLKPQIRELGNLSHTVEETSEMVEGLTDSMVKLAAKGKISTASYAGGLSKLAQTYRSTLNEAQNLAKQIQDSAKDYIAAKDQAAELDKQIKELNATMGTTAGKTVENQKKLEELTAQHQAATDTQQRSAVQTQLLTERYSEQTKAVTESMQAMVDWGFAARESNRQSRMMQGGLSGMIAPLEAIADAKFIHALDMIFKGGLVLQGLKMINDGTKSIAQYYKVNTELSQRLGVESKKGFGGFIDAAFEAQKSAAGFAVTAAELGMSMEEVSAIGDKVRIGIKIDAQGKLSEQAVRNLTKEVATFAKVTGIDADQATEMLAIRMKTMNMTAQQAQSDLMGMRVQLERMNVGLTKNNIPLEEMVELINKAGQESNSYVTDTRLMTGALRAAADQATRLGASQTLAKQTASGLGKSLGTSTEAVTVPMGLKMAKMLRDAPKKALKGLTEDQKKFAMSVRDSMMKGEMGEYQAGQILNEQLKNSAAGMEANLQEQLKFAKGPMAPKIFVQLGLADSDSAAYGQITALKEAEALQKQITTETGKTVSLTELMAKNSKKFGEALKGAKDEQERINILTQKLGMTPDDAQEYLKIQKDFANDLGKQRANTEVFLAAALDPMEKADKLADRIADMKSKGSSDKEIADKLISTMNLQSDEGKKAVHDLVGKFDDMIADMKSKGSSDKEIAESQKGNARDQLANLLNTDNTLVEKQKAAQDDFYKKLSGGFFSAAEAIVDKITGGMLKGPAAGVVGGAAAVGIGAIGLYFAKKSIINALVRNPVKEAIQQTLLGQPDEVPGLLRKGFDAAKTRGMGLLKSLASSSGNMFKSLLPYLKGMGGAAMNMAKGLARYGAIAYGAYAVYDAAKNLGDAFKDNAKFTADLAARTATYGIMDWLANPGDFIAMIGTAMGGTLSRVFGRSKEQEKKDKADIKDNAALAKTKEQEKKDKADIKDNAALAKTVDKLIDAGRNADAEKLLNANKFDASGRRGKIVSLHDLGISELGATGLPDVQLHKDAIKTLDRETPAFDTNGRPSVRSEGGGYGVNGQVSASLDASTAMSDDTVMVKFTGLSSSVNKMKGMSIAS